MKIRILKTIRGADDGIRVELYEAGTEYEVSEDLGTQLILAEAAEEITETPESAMPDEPETPEKPKPGRKRK